MSNEREDSKEQNRDNLLRSKNIQTQSTGFSIKQVLALSDASGSTIDGRTSVIVVPSLQRYFEWWLDRIERLFDSLMKGLPTGRLLLWKIAAKDKEQLNFNHFITKFNGRDRVGDKVETLEHFEDTYAVLDGQQRITALRISLKGSYMVHIPRRPKDKDTSYSEHSLFLCLDEDEYVAEQYENYKFWSIETSETERLKEKMWFRVSEILDESFNIDAYLSEVFNSGKQAVADEKGILPNEDALQKKRDFAHALLTRLYDVVHSEKQIILADVLSDIEIRDVIHSFIRLNSSGVELSTIDYINSLAIAYWPSEPPVDPKDLLKSFSDTYTCGQYSDYPFRDWSLVDYFYQVALFVFSPTSVFRVDSFNQEVMLKIYRHWDDLCKVHGAIFNLIIELDCVHKSNASYVMRFLKPLAYYLFNSSLNVDKNFDEQKLNDVVQNNRSLMKQWLSVSLILNPKSFSVNKEKHDPIVETHKVIDDHLSDNRFPLQHLLCIYKEPRYFNKDENDDKTVHDHVASYFDTCGNVTDELINYLLTCRFATDRAKYVLIAACSIKESRRSDTIALDHLFPRNIICNKDSFFWTGDYWADKQDELQTTFEDWSNKCHSIANLQILNGRDNSSKSDKRFSDWIQDNLNHRHRLCIPEDAELYQEKNFDKFLAQRKELLRARLKDRLIGGVFDESGPEFEACLAKQREHLS